MQHYPVPKGKPMSDRPSIRPLIFVALAATLAFAGCTKPADTANTTAANDGAAPLPTLPATLPMATGAATAATVAPPVAALPAARPIRAVRVANSRDAYAYADDADAFSHAVGSAPPDYGFDYQGTEPWAWQGYDQSRTFVEPVADGYRYYYYRPGADTPYFVRDPDYGYGFDNGSIAVIYTAGGAILPYADYGPRLGYASRYLRRGEDLYRASRGNERRAVIAANWAARQDAIAASRDRWAAAEAQQAGWQAYRARVADQQAQHWAQEAARRDADAQRFAAWHDDGFRSAPPPRAIPVAWQQAPWAQDQQRYRVADRQVQPAVQPAFQRPTDGAGAGGRLPAMSVPDIADRQGQPSPRAFDGRHPGAPVPADAMTPRDAAGAAQRQANATQDQRRQAAQAMEQRQPSHVAAQAALPQQVTATRQQRAATAGEQLQTDRSQAQEAARQQQQATRRAQQSARQQQEAIDRQQQAAVRPADRAQPVDHAQPAAVHVHRGGGEAPDMIGNASRDQQREQPPVRSQPPHEDQRQADRQQQQMAHQQEAAAHQQQAMMQHAPQQAQHAAAAPHAAPPPHPAPAPHATPAQRAEGAERGGHHD